VSNIEQLIEEYIQRVLADVSDLSDIRSWLLGSVPVTQIGQDRYPLCRIMVGPSRSSEDSITHWGTAYTGLISFSISQATNRGTPDGFDKDTDSIIQPESFARVRNWKHAAIDELRKNSYLDMEGLTYDSETVCYLDITERSSGAGFDGERNNNWMNVSTIQFDVVTEKPRE